jgi:hypothetical protein
LGKNLTFIEDRLNVMKYMCFLFGLLIGYYLLSADFASAQQDPADPGSADTVYLEPGGLSSEEGDTLFIPSDASGGDVLIYIKIWSDNPIQAIGVPLIDACGVGFLDSSKNDVGSTPICFQGSRVEEFGSLTLNLNLNPPKVMYGAVSLGSPLASGVGLFARMIYTIPPEVSPVCICLDSSFFPPGNHLSFVRTDAVGYVPIFKNRCFQVASTEVTDMKEGSPEKRLEFDLRQNYPNPLNSLTTIPFIIDQKQPQANSPVHITLSVYNVLGQKVRTLLDQKKSPGIYQISWDGKDETGKDVASGIYLYKLSSKDITLTRKMLLLR